MKHYCDCIPLSLAEKLYEKGMPMITSVSISIVEDKPVVDKNGEQWYRPMFCEVFDWLMDKGYRIMVHTKPANNPIKWFAYIGNMQPDFCIIEKTEDCYTWHEAAEKAIEKALTLI